MEFENKLPSQDRKLNLTAPKSDVRIKLDKNHWRRDSLLTANLSLQEKNPGTRRKSRLRNSKNVITYKNKLDDDSQNEIIWSDTSDSSDEEVNDDVDSLLDEKDVASNGDPDNENEITWTDVSDLSDEEKNEDANLDKEVKIEIPNADTDAASNDDENNPSQSNNVVEAVPTEIKSEQVTDSQKKGRKNIRPLLTREELAEATRKAEEEEEQRSFRIERKQQFLSSQLTEEDELILDTIEDGEHIKVDPYLCKKLYPHQRKGVSFMWDACYESIEMMKESKGQGCILAHCMGLGKTFQVVTLIHTLFAHPVTNTKYVLVICPVSTVLDWVREIKSGLETAMKEIDLSVEYIEGTDSLIVKCLKINRWRNNSGVLLMGYEAFVHLIFGQNATEEVEKELNSALLNPGPDLVVCDEGHLLKNGKTQRTRALSKIKTRRRIILSGTPMQNNLKEYYYMVSFVKPNILGTFREYSNRFVLPITNGQYADSTEEDIMVMKKRSHVLNRHLKNIVQRYEVAELNKYLKPIKNYTIFIQLHPVQAALYKYYITKAKGHFISTERDKNTNLFNDMNIAKYICSHPYLLSLKEEEVESKKSTDVSLGGEDNVPKEFFANDWWKEKCSESDLINIDCGTKMKLALAIIEEAERLGEKVLIFTSSLIELTAIEYFLKKVGTTNCKTWHNKRDYFRMDGSVSPTKRAKMCSYFNNPSNKQFRVFLISYKVGGLGLTLTAANRVIILGSMFNPVYDTQSIYRCYRFGQTKTVYVYRLISMGTMEEKIYRRCVSKLALACRVVDKHQIDRHYDTAQMMELYVNDVDLNLPKPTLSKPDDDLLATLILKFDSLHKYLDHQGLLENRPEDDLNEEDQKRAWEEFSRECEANARLLTPIGPNIVASSGIQSGIFSNASTSSTIGSNFTARPSYTTSTPNTTSLVTSSNSLYRAIPPFMLQSSTATVPVGPSTSHFSTPRLPHVSVIPGRFSSPIQSISKSPIGPQHGMQPSLPTPGPLVGDPRLRAPQNSAVVSNITFLRSPISSASTSVNNHNDSVTSLVGSSSAKPIVRPMIVGDPRLRSPHYTYNSIKGSNVFNPSTSAPINNSNNGATSSNGANSTQPSHVSRVVIVGDSCRSNPPIAHTPVISRPGIFVLPSSNFITKPAVALPSSPSAVTSTITVGPSHSGNLHNAQISVSSNNVVTAASGSSNNHLPTHIIRQHGKEYTIRIGNSSLDQRQINSNIANIRAPPEIVPVKKLYTKNPDQKADINGIVTRIKQTLNNPSSTDRNISEIVTRQGIDKNALDHLEKTDEVKKLNENDRLQNNLSRGNENNRAIHFQATNMVQQQNSPIIKNNNPKNIGTLEKQHSKENKSPLDFTGDSFPVDRTFLSKIKAKTLTSIPDNIQYITNAKTHSTTIQNDQENLANVDKLGITATDKVETVESITMLNSNIPKYSDPRIVDINSESKIQILSRNVNRDPKLNAASKTIKKSKDVPKKTQTPSVQKLQEIKKNIHSDHGQYALCNIVTPTKEKDTKISPEIIKTYGTQNKKTISNSSINSPGILNKDVRKPTVNSQLNTKHSKSTKNQTETTKNAISQASKVVMGSTSKKPPTSVQPNVTSSTDVRVPRNTYLGVPGSFRHNKSTTAGFTPVPNNSSTTNSKDNNAARTSQQSQMDKILQVMKRFEKPENSFQNNTSSSRKLSSEDSSLPQKSPIRLSLVPRNKTRVNGEKADKKSNSPKKNRQNIRNQAYLEPSVSIIETKSGRTIDISKSYAEGASVKKTIYVENGRVVDKNKTLTDTKAVSSDRNVSNTHLNKSGMIGNHVNEHIRTYSKLSANNAAKQRSSVQSTSMNSASGRVTPTVNSSRVAVANLHTNGRRQLYSPGDEPSLSLRKPKLGSKKSSN